MRTTPMWGALLGAALLLPATLEAQDPVGQGATAAVATPPGGVEQAELAFEREVFVYPTFTRRNPFQTLLAGADAGPRWETMRLEGILHDADPQHSIAIVSSGRANAPGGNDSARAGQTARLRVGQRWGNIRVLAIHPDNILIEVEEFGLTEQRTMRLPARGQGGQR